MRFLKHTLDLFVFGNLLIAIAAVCMTYVTQLLLFNTLFFHPYLMLVFFATWFVYNSHRVWGIFTAQEKDYLPARVKWAILHKQFMYFITFCSFAGMLTYVFICKLNIIVFLAPLAIPALGYTFPIIGKCLGIASFRTIPAVKTFLIAFVWAAVTVLIPVVYNNANIDKPVQLQLIERFVFIFALTLPFEMRDIALDKKDGIKSIAVLLGFERTMLIAKTTTITLWGIYIIHYADNLRFSLPMVLSAFITWLAVKNTKADSGEYHYLLLLDGMMILQLFLLILFVIL